jgi:galactitol-specific phosphotransferase system IIB component
MLFGYGMLNSMKDKVMQEKILEALTQLDSNFEKMKIDIKEMNSDLKEMNIITKDMLNTSIIINDKLDAIFQKTKK